MEQTINLISDYKYLLISSLIMLPYSLMKSEKQQVKQLPCPKLEHISVINSFQLSFSHLNTCSISWQLKACFYSFITTKVNSIFNAIFQTLLFFQALLQYESTTRVMCKQIDRQIYRHTASANAESKMLHNIKITQ